MCRNNYRLPLRGTILNSGRGGGLAREVWPKEKLNTISKIEEKGQKM